MWITWSVTPMLWWFSGDISEGLFLFICDLFVHTVVLLLTLRWILFDQDYAIKRVCHIFFWLRVFSSAYGHLFGPNSLPRECGESALVFIRNRYIVHILVTKFSHRCAARPSSRCSVVDLSMQFSETNYTILSFIGTLKLRRDIHINLKFLRILWTHFYETSFIM